MRFDVRHATRYHYRQPVSLRPHRLMLHPRGNAELRVTSFSLTCEPSATVEWTQDVFGNLIATATFAAMTRELEIVGTAIVDQSAPEWPIFAVASDAHRFPFAYSGDDVIDLGALRTPSVSGQAEVAAWARSFVMGATTDTLSLLKDLNAGLIDIIAYRVRDEEGTQQAAETLALRSGSCRDIAALFIEAVRTLGFGARAVSGYLSDVGMQGDFGGSTHAWAEVYLPGAGWIAFDPTHKRVGNAHLIPVAVGRCNGQIMPVVGDYLGQPTDFVGMEVRVDVRARAEA